MDDNAARVADAAGSQHRNPHRVEDLRCEGQRGDRADVSASLRSGGDDGIDAFVLHSPRILHGGDHGNDLAPGCLEQVHSFLAWIGMFRGDDGPPSSMHVAAHRSAMPRPMGMMLTPNGRVVRARTAAISALSFWSVPPTWP